jgi:hypothetical protein
MNTNKHLSPLLLSLTISLLCLCGLIPSAEAVLVLPEHRPGNNQSIKSQPASVLINAPARQLFLLDGAQRVLKTYPVAVGRPGFPTPQGQFKVIRKVMHPGFENPYKAAGASRIAPGSNNPLGTRWIGFHPVARGEYGIHGTNRPGSVGKFASHGCVRMYVKDAEDLFDRVTFGMPVVVSYDRTLVLTQADGVYLTVAPDPFGKSSRGSLGSVKQAIASFYPKAEIVGTVLQQGLASNSTTKLKIGNLPDPDEYNKIIETSVQVRIPGKNISIPKESTETLKHTDY